MRRAAAFHESGHAVAALTLGYSVWAATINQRSGHCIVSAPNCEHDDALILHAGTIAQHIALPGSPLGRSDFRRLADIPNADQFRAEAEALVRRHWDAIEAVALRLLECGALGAYEIKNAGGFTPRAQWVS